MNDIDAFMQGIRPDWRYHWCEARACACLGCVNISGQASGKFTKAEWEEWVKRHPEKAK